MEIRLWWSNVMSVWLPHMCWQWSSLPSHPEPPLDNMHDDSQSRWLQRWDGYCGCKPCGRRYAVMLRRCDASVIFHGHLPWGRVTPPAIMVCLSPALFWHSERVDQLSHCSGWSKGTATATDMLIWWSAYYFSCTILYIVIKSIVVIKNMS